MRKKSSTMLRDNAGTIMTTRMAFLEKGLIVGVCIGYDVEELMFRI